jgi:hypothetical protein
MTLTDALDRKGPSVYPLQPVSTTVTFILSPEANRLVSTRDYQCLWTKFPDDIENVCIFSMRVSLMTDS